MASVTKQGSKWTVRYLVNGVHRRYTLPEGSSRRDAEKMQRKIQTAIDNDGDWAPAGRSTDSLEQLVGEYRDFQRAAGMRPATLRTYAILDRFTAHARGRASVAGIDRLTREVVTAFLKELRDQGAGESSVANYARRIRAWWAWAHEEHPKLVPAPRMPRVKTPPLPKVIAPAWAEIDRMLDELEGAVVGRNRQPQAVKRACLVQRYTGIRVSQAAGLLWADYVEDVDGLGPGIHIRPEIGKTLEEREMNRIIPVHAALDTLLRSWRSADGTPGDGTPIVGARMPRDPHLTVSLAWQRAGVSAERWTGHPTHAIRKRVISDMLERGIADSLIDHLVGHAKRGVRARHYEDTLALFPLLKVAVAAFPCASLGDLGADGRHVQEAASESAP